MRIIAGEFKGRRIDAPKGSDTRPTLDRVKESLFGIIQFELYGRTVLDLFAGSGSLGIEAMSRGARLVVFNDASSECARLIRQNLEKLHASSAFEVFARDGLDLLTMLVDKLSSTLCFSIRRTHQGLHSMRSINCFPLRF